MRLRLSEHAVLLMAGWTEASGKINDMPTAILSGAMALFHTCGLLDAPFEETCTSFCCIQSTFARTIDDLVPWCSKLYHCAVFHRFSR